MSEHPTCPFCGVVEPCRVHVVAPAALTPQQNDVDSCRDELIGKLQDCFAYPENAVKMVSRFETALRESMREAVQPPATPQEPERCAICGWTLADSIDAGCVRGNCSMRPFPERYFDSERAALEYGGRLPKEKVRASTPSPEGQTWQPIETAPKDGTPVLLWWRDEHDVEWWACGRWRQFGDGSRGWFGESFHSSEVKSWTRLLGECPTHWMPLPSPPTPEGTQP